MDDLRDLLQENCKEELSDHEKYKLLSEYAEEIGEHKIAKVLMDLSNEEKSHAEIIQNLISTL